MSSQETSFVSLYEAHYGRVLAYCQRRTDHDRARDAAAEVFAVAWRRVETVPQAEPLPWLLRTARMVLNDQQRSLRRQDRVAARTAGLPPSVPAEYADHAERVANTDRVARLLAGMSAQDQEVLRLHAWDDLDPAAIATVLGCSSVAARVRLHRARKRFALAVQEESYQDSTWTTPGALPPPVVSTVNLETP